MSPSSNIYDEDRLVRYSVIYHQMVLLLKKIKAFDLMAPYKIIVATNTSTYILGVHFKNQHNGTRVVFLLGHRSDRSGRKERITL